MNVVFLIHKKIQIVLVWLTGKYIAGCNMNSSKTCIHFL